MHASPCISFAHACMHGHACVQPLTLTKQRTPNRPKPPRRFLLTYLAAYFRGVTATPHIIHGDMLERALVASGMVMPFAGPSETGGTARFGAHAAQQSLRACGRLGGYAGCGSFSCDCTRLATDCSSVWGDLSTLRTQPTTDQLTGHPPPPPGWRRCPPQASPPT